MPVDSPIGTPSVVIFTAHFGQSDIVMPPAQTIPGVEFIVLTDEVVRVPKPWKIRMVTIPPNVTNPRLKNRWCKLHANRLLPDFGVSVYVDTHIQIIGDLRPLIFEFCNSGATLGVLRHPHSHSIDEEVARSLRTGRISREDHAANWSTQSERQRAEGFRDDLGVYYATVVMRRHLGPLLAEFEDAWWQELNQGVLRDQVALPFALWSTGISHQVFLLPWSLQPYFRHWGHLPRWTLRERVLRFFDCRVDSRPAYRWVLRVLRLRVVARSLLAARAGRHPDHSLADGQPRGART